MTKNMYIQPSVEVVEVMMAQTLCVSGGGGFGIIPDAETDEQL